MTETNTQRRPITPFVTEYSLKPGERYPIQVSTSKARDAIYLGKNIAFGCTCCGASSGVIWGYFFANQKRNEIIVIPEQDIGTDEKARVRADRRVLIREFTLEQVSFENIMAAKPENHFYGHLSVGAM